jgi:hypothetical protein
MGNNSIICVNRKQYQDDDYWMGSLTIGKMYKILQTYNDNGIEFMIKNDYGFEHIYPESMFKTIQEFRQEKLNELGI